MKVRTDYVSNSSSSSFVLIGDAFDRKDIEHSSFFKMNANEDNYDEDAWRGKCAELGLSVANGIENYYGQYVIGLSYYDMKDDETKAAFQMRILDLLRTAFPEKNYIEVDIREDAGYDG